MSAGQTIERTDWSLDRRAFWAITVAGSSLAVIMLDATGVNLAFPLIEEAFPDTSRATLAWMPTGYSMALAALMMLAGRLADSIGRRRIFRIGMVVFGVSSLLSAVVAHPLAIIALRFVTGSGGALVMATGLALALPEFPAHRRSMAVGIFGSIGALAVALGPPLAATAVELLGWRGVFLIAPGLALPVALLAPRAVQEYARDPADDGHRVGLIDWLGAALGTIGIGALILALLETSRSGWTDPRALAAFAVALTALPTFVRRCTTQAEPLLDLDLFKSRHFAVGNIFQAWTQLPLYAWMFSTPIFLVNVWGWSVWAAGLALGLPMLLSFSAIPAGRYVERVGHRRILAAGAVCGLASSVWLLAMMGDDPDRWWVWIPEILIWGLSTGLAGTMGSSASLHGITEERLGQANAAHMTIRRLGQAFGPVLVVVALGGDRATADNLSSFQTLWWVLVVLWSLAIVAALAYPD